MKKPNAECKLEKYGNVSEPKFSSDWCNTHGKFMVICHWERVERTRLKAEVMDAVEKTITEWQNTSHLYGARISGIQMKSSLKPALEKVFDR